MLEFNTVKPNINNYPVSQDIAQKTFHKTVDVEIGDILSILDKADGQALIDILRGPELASPSGGLNTEKSSALKAYLQEKMKDPQFVRDLGALQEKIESGVNKLMQDKVKEQADQGKPFDITGLSSSAVALIVAANVLMLSLNNADTELSSKLSLVSFDAAKSTAASMVREGLDTLSGSIAQSTLQLGITGVGAKMEHKGLKAERKALKTHGKQIDGLNKELKGLGPESHSRRNQIESEISAHQLALDDKKLLARDKQTSGDAVMKSSQAVGTIAGGSGQYTAAVERSEQQISQANSRVASTASEDSRESSRKTLSLIAELLRMMDSISQSKNAALGAVAGNLRA